MHVSEKKHLHHVFHDLLHHMMGHYSKSVPQLNQIFRAMEKKQLIHNPQEVENDHIAFRTFQHPHLGIHSLEKIFLHFGYIKKEALHFAEKKLDAYWYAPPSDEFPRIFISEIKVKDLSQKAQNLINHYLKHVHQDPVNTLHLDDVQAVANYLHSLPWPKPKFCDYEYLQKESEYAAWVLAHGHQFNHFTFSVHNLPEGYNTLESFNLFLEQSGLRLNDSGGKIKISPDKKLLQSSTVAHVAPFEFSDGPQSIAGSFVEFAERKVLDHFLTLPKEQIKREHRRDGFEAANADKIFESTYASQTHKHK